MNRKLFQSLKLWKRYKIRNGNFSKVRNFGKDIKRKLFQSLKLWKRYKRKGIKRKKRNAPLKRPGIENFSKVRNFGKGIKY